MFTVSHDSYYGSQMYQIYSRGFICVKVFSDHSRLHAVVVWIRSTESPFQAFPLQGTSTPLSVRDVGAEALLEGW